MICILVFTGGENSLAQWHHRGVHFFNTNLSTIKYYIHSGLKVPAVSGMSRPPQSLGDGGCERTVLTPNDRTSLNQVYWWLICFPWDLLPFFIFCKLSITKYFRFFTERIWIRVRPYRIPNPCYRKYFWSFFYRMDIEHYESLKKRKNRINSITEDYSFLS